MKRLERRGLRNADNVVVIREHQRQFLIDELKISPKKITLIPNGVDVEIFKPQATPKKNQVVFVGRTTFPKGFNLLVDAANYIEGDIIVITQKGASELLARAQKTPNMQIIKSAPPEVVAGHYAESKVFILPSLDEEQPLTVLEALACGLPIVVSEKAASDVFTRESTVEGKVLDYLRPDTIAEAVNYYLRTSMGTIKRNRQIVVDQYSLENNLNHYLRLYEDS
ncbi:MAG: glycosyl transferase group 1 [Patescibacteria group bacterium]|nr:glycosyl transferase group 1 [Patescibacteria group bacterium]